MNHSMINSFVSMQSLQQKLDMVANNIANVNTTGFKRQQGSFADVLTNMKAQPEAFRQQGRLSPLGFNQGWGARLVQIQNDMTQGRIEATNNRNDLAIQGDGMFEVMVSTTDANGAQTFKPAWTRNGAFTLSPDANGNLVVATKDGHFLAGVDNNPIRIPNGHRVQIDADGRVMAYNENDPNAAPVEAGQIKLIRVVRPQLLQELGDGLFDLPADVVNTQNILQNVNGTPANPADRVEVIQGSLEMSNVNLADEMTELMMVQRAFQLNARALTSSETMLNLANNLRA